MLFESRGETWGTGWVGDSWKKGRPFNRIGGVGKSAFDNPVCHTATQEPGDELRQAAGNNTNRRTRV